MAAGATVSGGGGGDMSEVDGLQLKCNQMTDESLESTRRMMNLCAEAKVMMMMMIVMMIIMMMVT